VEVVIENTLDGTEGAHRIGNRMAQANVEERLEAFFAGAARFHAQAGDGRYRVVLDFPRREGPP
jgi:hypothetical protein